MINVNQKLKEINNSSDLSIYLYSMNVAQLYDHNEKSILLDFTESIFLPDELPSVIEKIDSIYQLEFRNKYNIIKIL